MENKYIKTPFLLLIFLILTTTSCSSDIAVVDRRQTDVIVDSFIQPYRVEQLDILVVIDTSGSMNDNFSTVGSGMEILRTDIETLTFDYKFGFITTDSSNLSFVGPYNSNATNIDIAMAPSLLSSAGGEAGFESTYVFYNAEGGNSFFREGSDFLLFLISDEDEQSSISAAMFKEWLESLSIFGRHDVVAITTLDYGEQCSYSWDVGYKYIELASLYNKNAIDICDNGWEIWLSDSSFLTQLRDYVQLTETPVQDSIVVYVNSERTNDWQYIEESNMVLLGFTPDYGSLIEIGYKINVD